MNCILFTYKIDHFSVNSCFKRSIKITIKHFPLAACQIEASSTSLLGPPVVVELENPSVGDLIKERSTRELLCASSLQN